jgi:hypothetical protein
MTSGTRPVLCAKSTTLTLTSHTHLLLVSVGGQQRTCFGAISAQFNEQSLYGAWAGGFFFFFFFQFFFSIFFFLGGSFYTCRLQPQLVGVTQATIIERCSSSIPSSPSVRLCWRRHDRTLLLAYTRLASLALLSRWSNCFADNSLRNVNVMPNTLISACAVTANHDGLALTIE